MIHARRVTQDPVCCGLDALVGSVDSLLGPEQEHPHRVPDVPARDTDVHRIWAFLLVRGRHDHKVKEPEVSHFSPFFSCVPIESVACGCCNALRAASVFVCFDPHLKFPRPGKTRACLLYYCRGKTKAHLNQKPEISQSAIAVANHATSATQHRCKFCHSLSSFFSVQHATFPGT